MPERRQQHISRVGDEEGDVDAHQLPHQHLDAVEGRRKHGATIWATARCRLERAEK